jgi:ribonuclease HI
MIKEFAEHYIVQTTEDMVVDDKILYIFTDGSKIDGPHKSIRFGAWGYWIPELNILHTGYEHITSQKGELLGALFAMTYINKHDVEKNDITIVTDSRYVIGALTGLYEKLKKNIKVIEKCKKLIENLKEKGKNISFVHVKAHVPKKDYFSRNNKIIDTATEKTAKKMKQKWIEGHKTKS